MIQIKLSALFTVSATILISGAMQTSVTAYPYSQQTQGYSNDDRMIRPGLYAIGTIASLQNNESGNPTWIVSGLWGGSLSANSTSQGGQGNQITNNTTNNTTNTSTTTNVTATKDRLPIATFHSKFNMVMTNGSAAHEHGIYNFTLTDISMPSNSTTVYNGTAVITMRQGPVPNVPVSIKAMNNNVISIWVDPAKINNHFGNTPVFGTIEKLVRVKK
jgi:hypothetical protein